MTPLERFLLRLRTGSRKACEDMLRTSTTDEVQGLEEEMRRAVKAGDVSATEWEAFLVLKRNELLDRVERGEVV